MKKLDYELRRRAKPIEKEKEVKANLALEEYANMFTANSDVVGVGIGSLEGEPFIQVYVKKEKAEKLSKIFPDKLGDYDVYYVESGSFTAR